MSQTPPSSTTSAVTAATQSPVLFETLRTARGYVFGHATLNAPASLNALSLDMVDLLYAQLQQWATDPQVVGVLLDAVSDKAFCAGGDVISLYRSIRETAAGEVPRAAAEFFEREYRLDHRIHTYPKPIVCWGNGIVMGGGVGLFAGASHRVVTPRTRLAMPEIGIGLYPDVGGSWVLSRLPWRMGLFLALTGASLNASDAHFCGMADFVIAHERHSELLQALGTTPWQGTREADAAMLSAVLEDLMPGTVSPDSPLAVHFDRIRAVIGHDRLRDLAPRLAALVDDPDPWLAQAARSFSKGSPTSAALGVEMQARARHLSLADVFRLEWQASVRCCMHPDFAEGVRALLIDKDKTPRWQPATLGEVTPQWIASHLTSPLKGAHPLADLA